LARIALVVLALILLDGIRMTYKPQVGFTLPSLASCIYRTMNCISLFS